MRNNSFPKTYFTISELPHISLIYQYTKIPIFFFIILSAISFFFPGKLKELKEIQEIESIDINNFTIQSVVNNFYPINQRLSIYFSFLGAVKEEYKINGGVFVACFKDGISVFNYTGLIPEFKINLIKDQMKIFEDFNINYDTVNVTIRFEQKPNFAKQFQIKWIFYNQKFVLFDLSVRFVSFILFIQLAFFKCQFNRSNERSFENRLNLFLLISTAIFYINPFSFLNLIEIPIKSKYLISRLHDFFYSFFYFYVLSILTNILNEIDPDYLNRFVSLAIPYFYLIISLIFLAKEDYFLYDSEKKVLSYFPKPFSDLTDWVNFSPTHLAVFLVFGFISFIFYILIFLILSKKSQKSQKFFYYFGIFYYDTFVIFISQTKIFYVFHLFKERAFFFCFEYFSILLSVVLCVYGSIEVNLI